MATAFDHPTQNSSTLWRILRFFGDYVLAYDLIAILAYKHIGKNPHYPEINGLFSINTIDCLVADLEFVGHNWLRFYFTQNMLSYLDSGKLLFTNPHIGAKSKVF